MQDASVTNPQTHFYNLMQRNLLSDENVFNLGMGFTAKDHEFFTLEKFGQMKAFDSLNKAIEFRFLLE